jgi:large subunit ribosomal protein L9
MKIILTQDVPRLGSEGDLVTVRNGYGRNFLIPTGKAMAATEANLARLKDMVKLKDLRVRKDSRNARAVADRLAGVSCTVRVQADEGDRLYGSVGPREIATALEDQGLEIDQTWIIMDEHIKMLGVFPVAIHLFKDVDAEIKVWVIRE